MIRAMHRVGHAMLALATLVSLAVALPAFAQETVDPNHIPPSRDPTRTANGLALTPPMGWNSWNKFGCSVDEKTVRSVADAMAAGGMRDAGYHYVVIDDCWHGPRDENGFITSDPKKFPSGMKALGDYIHSKGLKFGIYSDAGKKTCGGHPGSQGHEYQDALTYARWGVDYLKYDWCSTGTRNAEEAYALMEDALRATGRDIVFSICEWGQNRPWLWAAKIGNLWRTTGDIWDSYSASDKAHWWAHNLLDIVDQNEPLWPFAGPGHWNDPDMLEIGNGGMSDIEYRTHFSLWAMMAAPLMAGNDIASMSPDTAAILMNRDVIAIDQDPLGAQGHRVRDDGNQEVWARPLANGGRAVLLLNRGEAPADIAVDWPELGYPRTIAADGRDLWAHKPLGRLKGRYAATVAPHGVVMISLLP
ncbi:hypothetical protein GCM10009087_43510 [Sphingomonas oligophenolica]|uniref:Alpha-galactosidase n=1 Tax=Sphingomonas oligophenolica TaxID=301154 RepID=A0ABU9XZL8_9SPHN